MDPLKSPEVRKVNQVHFIGIVCLNYEDLPQESLWAVAFRIHLLRVPIKWNKTLQHCSSQTSYTALSNSHGNPVWLSDSPRITQVVGCRAII